ncbi:type II toxin-antitoxin system RelE/ParE family toxin [Ciceribacter sp. L1K22]|uniref:type II toxin-antitoxin system RelE family toxin n=1 Tax=Ciceribacter sp. L1K22 TaxID=2820275 RepID=UPI001ABDBDAB|nr:type II toxin-antitoxin system RelE/ParE family toxin [Ciceribacter sp. L1K22]MBO3761130.1 type II toxin-antitoxin system RelE/ParE family toxin [Ciceribacter sp. L1K22]
MVAKQIIFSKQASQTLARIPVNERRRITRKIEQYAEDPRSQANNVVKLQDRPGYRLRVGDWRVIFDEYDNVLDIQKIASRGSVY